jgi:uncharacterized protein YqiB (DUF1249 family)
MADDMKPRYKVNLDDLHAVWAANYAAIIQLLPQLRDKPPAVVGVSGLAQVEVVVVERGPHTVVLDIRQPGIAGALGQSVAGCEDDLDPAPDPTACEFRLRVYHDARMAEVIASQGHRYLKPRYDYPNRNMYHCDEKYQVNCLLGEWLKYCLVRRAAVSPCKVIGQGG